MEKGKPVVNSETPYDEDNCGVGRSYECTFCKRGFTNAKALGGHMNIHRKEKGPKAMHRNRHEDHNPSIHRESYLNLRCCRWFSDTADNQQRVQYRSQGDNHVHLPLSNPNFQTGNYDSYNQNRVPGCRDGRLGENMSLRIGRLHPRVEDEEAGLCRDKNVLENEVDLELRLGDHP